ncbi:proline--tRNA ligase [Candidatus Peregrinibacteria bacterium]|jgi:prolyl-tRNA synthetase|nr:proline--tRNA ligase [Candidatus Peregrinibacteria bacterium]MBT4631371.1 proline--tRNA ligase [Candidatus Peregrinibacteria bacterium]MBT5517172.1 proline--tRNA ligase [Candidatus Peregrinibacteria bacterium]MBT5823754.1 proline--tRNA ligase [Candidatus Peregrinibacteria bacterium]
MSKLTPQSQDFPKWYQDVVQMADLAEHSQVKGCMVIKPYGYAIWENIQKDLDARIKAAGVQNAYFPLFIPQSFLTREANHVEGFAPECATVTHGGGKELAEPLVVRPTSETIIYDTYSRWVQSYRDLPLLINQWANVVRWEMRTRPFLRTTEFLWQEGHTAHASKEEAETEVKRALDMYVDMDRELLALPVLTGKKSEKETFAGADYTCTTEALARDGKAIQAGTSHLLGQTFAKAFDIKFQDEKGEVQHVWQTSWGVSTRMVGTIIVCHGDEKGLRLPPRVAPIQVVLVPIFKTDEDKIRITQELGDLVQTLEAHGVRVKFDERDNLSPGWKFNEWEIKGVPIRIEMGPRDLEKSEVVVARRDTSEKNSMPMADLASAIPDLLEEIQANMLKQAEEFLNSSIHEADSVEEMKKILDEKGGFVKAAWAGSSDDEKIIQDKTKATIRIISDEPLSKKGTCILTGKETDQLVYFAKAY